jgi:hypothetical protein
MTINSILLCYNHQATDNHNQWRFVHNDLENPCASTTFPWAGETIEQEDLGKGELVSKWHIRLINPTETIQKNQMRKAIISSSIKLYTL